jgi:hypothetical protein
LKKFPGSSHALYVRYCPYVFASAKQRSLLFSDNPIKPAAKMTGLVPMLYVGIQNTLELFPPTEDGHCHYYALLPANEVRQLSTVLLRFWQNSPLLLGVPNQVVLHPDTLRADPALAGFLQDQGILPVVMDGCKSHRQESHVLELVKYLKRQKNGQVNLTLTEINHAGIYKGVCASIRGVTEGFSPFPEDVARTQVLFYKRTNHLVLPQDASQITPLSNLDALPLELLVAPQTRFPNIEQLTIEGNRVRCQLSFQFDNYPLQKQYRDLIYTMARLSPVKCSVIARQCGISSNQLQSYFDKKEALPEDIFEQLRKVVLKSTLPAPFQINNETINSLPAAEQGYLLVGKQMKMVRTMFTWITHGQPGYCFEVRNVKNNPPWVVVFGKGGHCPSLLIPHRSLHDQTPESSFFRPFPHWFQGEMRVPSSMREQLNQICLLDGAMDPTPLLQQLRDSHEDFFSEIERPEKNGRKTQFLVLLAKHEKLSGTTVTDEQLAEHTATPLSEVQRWLHPYRILGNEKDKPSKQQLLLIQYALGLISPPNHEYTNQS